MHCRIGSIPQCLFIFGNGASWPWKSTTCCTNKPTSNNNPFTHTPKSKCRRAGKREHTHTHVLLVVSVRVRLTVHTSSARAIRLSFWPQRLRLRSTIGCTTSLCVCVWVCLLLTHAHRGRNPSTEWLGIEWVERSDRSIAFHWAIGLVDGQHSGPRALHCRAYYPCLGIPEVNYVVCTKSKSWKCSLAGVQGAVGDAI